MQFSVPIFIIVLLLGVLQLAVGVVIGRCLPVGDSKSPPPNPEDAGRVRRFTARLRRLADRVADEEKLPQQTEQPQCSTLCGDGAAESAQLQTACDQLRRRLAQVAEDDT